MESTGNLCDGYGENDDGTGRTNWIWVTIFEISSASKWIKALTTTTNSRMKLLLLDTADIKILVDTEGSKMEIDLFSFHSFPVYKMKQHFFFAIVRLINRWSKRNWKLFIKENFVKYKIDYFIPMQFNQINRTINLKSPKNPTLVFWVRLLKKRSISWNEWQCRLLCALCPEFIHLGPAPLLPNEFHHLVKNR